MVLFKFCKYPLGILNTKSLLNGKMEINNIIADSTATANKLKLFWNKAENDDKWKL